MYLELQLHEDASYAPSASSATLHPEGTESDVLGS